MADAAVHDSPHSPSSGPSRAKVLLREPLVLNNRSYSWVTNRIAGIVENPQPKGWWFLVVPCAMLVAVMVFCFTFLVSTGVGVWGPNHPVAWGWDITNFVFWIGIGHAGTLISAILYLTRQKWRTAVNRAAEAMTIFAVMCAGLFPALHVGRVWMAWFLAPIPNSNAIWQNFKSPLLWDVFAVSTYFSVSVVFWFLGLVPDLATASLASAKWHMGFLRWGGAAAIVSGATTRWPTVCSQPFPLLWYCRCTPWFPSTLRPRLYLVGTPPFSRPTLWLEPFSAVSPWC